MTTLADLVDDCYNLLYGTVQAERPTEDTLASGLAEGAEEITMTTPLLWKRGDYAESPAGELLIFTEDHPTSGSATVRREQRGTESTAPYGAGVVMHRNPTYPRKVIERFVNQVVRNDLWPHVWTWHRDSLSFVSGETAYPLDDYIDEVVRVYQYDLNSDGRFYPLDRNAWDVERVIDGTLVGASSILRLRTVFDESETVYYTAKRRPAVADLANLDDEIAELVPWAVVGKLSPGARAVARRHTPATDRGEEAEGAEYRDYRGFMSEFVRMRKALNLKLSKDVPPLVKFRPRRRGRTW